MKRLILILIFLITILSASWADNNKVSLVKEYTDVPVELRGAWHALSFSVDEGETVEGASGTIIFATQFYLCTIYHNDRIIKTELFSHEYGPSYFLYSEDKSIMYMVVFYKETPDTPVLYMIKDDEEQLRCCIKIVKI